MCVEEAWPSSMQASGVGYYFYESMVRLSSSLVGDFFSTALTHARLAEAWLAVMSGNTDPPDDNHVNKDGIPVGAAQARSFKDIVMGEKVVFLTGARFVMEALSGGEDGGCGGGKCIPDSLKIDIMSPNEDLCKALGEEDNKLTNVGFFWPSWTF